MFELLGSPGEISGLRTKNRFIHSPLHSMLVDANGHVTPELLAYQRERALGGAGLCFTEYAFIDHDASRANLAQLSCADDHAIPGLARLAETIRFAGALAGMQLNHAGRQRFLATAPIVAPSRVPWEWLHSIGAPVPTQLSAEGIAEIVASFGRAASRVRMAGFDLVELHAGHGYLVGQFLSGITNRRDDLYGGDLVARQRFLLEIVAAMRRAVGDDFPITVRLSGTEGQPEGITLEETVETARALEKAGVALIDISAGNHHTMDIQVQPMYAPVAVNASAAAAVRRAVRIPVSVVGSVVIPLAAEELLERGDADFVRLGRPLLADPHYPRKVLSGRPETVRPCIRCNECLDRGVGRKRHVVCAVNFACGREAALTSEKPRSQLRVVIVGGGIAGLEAAAVAAENGHSVTLFERNRLGGSLNDIAASEIKVDLRRYLDWLLQRAEGRFEHLQAEATADDVRQLEPDAVILATGARPAEHGDGIVDIRTALARPDSVGARVVVVGGGQFAVEAAWEFARAAKRVAVVAREATLASDVGPHTSIPLLKAIDELGVDTRLGCSHISASVGACRLLRSDGTEEEIAYDTLVTSSYVPAGELAASLADESFAVVSIGDCVSPRRILDAVWDANVAIRQLS
ncbi:MAG: FAD-dependent oxidoreductase [Thermoleophilia bacterium]|nr:FAD-dependent oxidoreductase [Thermoleophilia bacterium]